MLQRLKDSTQRALVLVCTSQLVSFFGFELVGFVLAVLVYERTGSVVLFALVAVATLLPLVVAPALLGRLLQRANPRWVMILGDSVSALCSLVLLALLTSESLVLWQIYLLRATSALGRATRETAFATTLVNSGVKPGSGSPIDRLLENAHELMLISSLLLGGLLIVVGGFPAVLLVSAVAFISGALVMLLMLFTQPAPAAAVSTAATTDATTPTNMRAFIAARPGLRALLILYVLVNFVVGSAAALVVPLVLSFGSGLSLGIAAAVGSSGALLGRLVMGWWRPVNHMAVLSGFVLLQGLALIVASLQPSVALIAVAAFTFLFSLSIVSGCDRNMWRAKVAAPLHEQVFGLRKLASFVTLFPAYLLAGPLADYVFEPLLAPGGALAGSVGQMIGIGTGRGVALQMLLVGCLAVVTALYSLIYPRLRLLDRELPDVTAAEGSAQPPQGSFASS